MPTHDGADVIGFAIESVLAQTEGNFELLVVGDGASEPTAAVIDGFQDSRIRWFPLPKASGFGYANRNTALAQSRGSLVAFAADDDLMLPDHLASFATIFDNLKIQLAYSQVLWVSSDGIAAPDLTNLSFSDERQHFLERGNTLAAGGLVYRASALPERTVWPEHLAGAGDWDIWKRIIGLHGMEAVHHLRVPTCLHFSAKRKQARHSRSPRLAQYLQIADRWADYPTNLRGPAEGDRGPEQARYWHWLQSDPVGTSQRLRGATQDLIMRLALAELCGADVTDVFGRASGSRPADAAAEFRIGQLQDELAALQASRIWRLTAPFRALLDRLKAL